MIKNTIAIIMVLAGIIVLCALGNWQLERASWKNNIIAQLETEYAKDAMQHPLKGDDLQNTAIQQGYIKGWLDQTKQILMGPKTKDGEIGYNALIPLKLTDGDHVLVDMGWLKGDKRADIDIPIAPQGTPLIVTGIARKPDWNNFTPNNSAENNSWTKLDITQIASARNITRPVPVIFYAKTTQPSFGEFKMLEENWMPRNKHMQYATFWFSMAVILLIFLAIFIVKNRKT